ncbi:MAG: thermonuclease family protein [Pikeienuella sp.]
MNRFTIILALGIGGSILGSQMGGTSGSATSGTTSIRVASSEVYAIDGDTIAIGEDRYRLMGFDTPETRFAKCDAERELGNQATRRLESLISAAQSVTLHVEPRPDRYDRFLAVLEADGQDVGPVLISEGLARPYDGGQRQGWCA